jgi:hypothetical protein
MVNGHVVLMCVLSAYTITKHLYTTNLLNLLESHILKVSDFLDVWLDGPGFHAVMDSLQSSSQYVLMVQI